jgi:hypothetical protein
MAVTLSIGFTMQLSSVPSTIKWFICEGQWSVVGGQWSVKGAGLGDQTLMAKVQPSIRLSKVLTQNRDYRA